MPAALHVLRTVLLIVSFLLSFLYGGQVGCVDLPEDRFHPQETLGGISEGSSPEKDSAHAFGREFCIASVQGYCFAGSENTNSVSVRVTQTMRRYPPRSRSTFRMVKDGKVIDNNRTHPFLAQSLVHSAGFYLVERYLFSICRLRL